MWRQTRARPRPTERHRQSRPGAPSGPRSGQPSPIDVGELAPNEGPNVRARHAAGSPNGDDLLDLVKPEAQADQQPVSSHTPRLNLRPRVNVKTNAAGDQRRREAADAPRLKPGRKASNSHDSGSGGCAV